MCFGGGTPDYTKKDYGALPSLGTGSATKTVTLGEPAPVRSSSSGSSLLESTMAAARASAAKSTAGPDAIPSSVAGISSSLRPPTKKVKGNSLLREAYLNITSPFMRG